MSEEEIGALVDAICDIRAVLEGKVPEDKGEIYRRLGLILAYSPGKRAVQADVPKKINQVRWRVCGVRGVRRARL